MDVQSYRFIVQCLGWCIVLLVIASISFGILNILGLSRASPGDLVPVLAPIGTLLGGLLVVPPTKK